MEFQYKCNSKIVSWIVSILFIVFGIYFFRNKVNDYSICVMILIINMIMQYVNYLGMKNKGRGIVEYLDYKHGTIISILGLGMIIFIILIGGENINYLMGGLLIILACGIIYSEDLLKKTHITEDGGYPADKIILNEDGIKIPEYRFIKWEDISNVIEYDSRGVSIIGVLVPSEREYKIKNSKIENLLLGKNVRLITMVKSRVRGVGGLRVSELVVAIKENMKG